MNPFFVYLLKSSLSLVFLYSLFRLTMRNDRNHSLNRFLLLAILFISVIIPAINIQFYGSNAPVKQIEAFKEYVLEPVFTEATAIETTYSTIKEHSSTINIWLIFYLSVIVALVCKITFAVMRITKMIKRAEKRQLHNIVLAVVNDLIQPFSFFNKIVLSQKDYTENKNMIVAHEHAHIKQKHALDLMVCEVFTVMQFFNPFMWLLRRDIKLIHEYQADQAVLNKGIDATKYQLLVLQKSVGERRFAMANNLRQKPILNRLKMMQTTNKKRWTSIKIILFAPALIMLLQAFSQPEILATKANELLPGIVEKDSTEVWLENWTVENLPNINGGLTTTLSIILPPPPGSPRYEKGKQGVPIRRGNVLIILINSKNQLLSEGKPVDKTELLIGVENFLNGKSPFNEVKKGPELKEINLPLVGDVKVSRGVISMQYDRGSDKTFIKNLLNSIGEKHLEARQKASDKYFSQDYFSLSTDKKDMINKIIPIRVSIVEPKVVKPRAQKSSVVKPSPLFSIFLRKDVTLIENSLSSSPSTSTKTSISEIQKKAKEFVKNVGTNKYNVHVWYSKDVPKEKRDKVEELLFFNGIGNVKIREIPPPPPPRKTIK